MRNVEDQTGFGKRRMMRDRMNQNGRVQGKAGWLLLWLLGVPIPVLFALFLLRGCT